MKSSFYDNQYVWSWEEDGNLICTTTNQTWDASYWTVEDWDEFCEFDHDRIAQVEMMTEVKA